MKQIIWPQFSKLSRRERFVAIGSLVVFLVMVLDRLVIGPWTEHSRTVHGEIHKLQSAIQQYHKLLERKPQVLEEVAAHREDLDQTRMEALDMALLLREIEDLRNQSGVSLKEVKPLEGMSDEFHNIFTLEVKCAGGLEQWIHFLYLLQTSKILWGIERATIASSAEDVALLEGSVRLTSKVLRGQPST